MSLSCRSAVQKYFILKSILKILFYFVFSKYSYQSILFCIFKILFRSILHITAIYKSSSLTLDLKSSSLSLSWDHKTLSLTSTTSLQVLVVGRQVLDDITVFDVMSRICFQCCFSYSVFQLIKY